MRKLLAVLLALMLTLALAGISLADESAEDDAAEDAPAETVILDTEDVSVMLVGESVNDRGDYIWTVRAENKTDAPVMVTMDRFVLNGTYCEAAFGMAVEAGETAEEANYWPAAALADAGLEGLTAAASACFRLGAFDTQDPEAVPYADQTVELTLQEGGAPAYEPADTDILLFDNDTAAMYITSFVPSPEISQYVVNVMIVNKSDDAISVEMADGYIGPEYMTSGYMKQFVPAHASASGSWGWGYEWMQWADYYGADGLIRKDLDMTLNLNIYDEDDATVPVIQLADVFVER